MYALIILKTNYADEFDLESFCILPLDYWVVVKNTLLQLDQDKEYEFYFGTNEYVELSIKDLFENIEEFELSEFEESPIYDYLGEEFGTLSITNIIDSILESNGNEEVVSQLFNFLDKSTFDIDEE